MTTDDLSTAYARLDSDVRYIVECCAAIGSKHVTAELAECLWAQYSREHEVDWLNVDDYTPRTVWRAVECYL